MQRLRKDPPIGKGDRFQLRPGSVHRIVRTVRYALQNSFAGPSQSGASVERTRQVLRRQSKLLHGAAQSHPRILPVSCAQISVLSPKYEVFCSNKVGRMSESMPFTVVRSPFGAHRSRFAVRRSAFRIALKAWLTGMVIPTHSGFCALSRLKRK
jgi:hypothetical protein